ncbi:MAG: glycosyltransferase family 2 protein [Lachnospiraceae bacterium]|nr:glycosyltransferase family 2 protein [Lachnospiraceae bacterium]
MSQEKDTIKAEGYYKTLYEEECAKNESLTQSLVDAEAKIADLEYKLDKIRKSRLWKAIYPVRLLWSHLHNLATRVKRYGNLRNLKEKIKSKIIERKAYKSYGTKSMPDEETIRAQRETVFDMDVTFSILVPLYNTPERYLREMIESVLAQTYVKWELCLADGSDEAHPEVGRICLQYRDRDEETAKGYGLAKSRILYRKLEQNLGISGNTNACYEMSTGNYIGLFDHDDILHPTVLYEYMKAICEKNADYIYCDETTFKGKSIDHMITMHFKPDFAIDNLRANNFICHFSVFDRTLLQETELFRSEFDGSQDHDMILRLTAVAKNIVHVPKILYYWRSHAGSVASDINAKSYAIDAAKNAVGAHLTSFGFSGFQIESTRAFETIFRIRYKLVEKPKVSILIPNKDHVTDLRRCITSITEKSSYPDYEIIVIENNSVDEETFAYYELLKKHPSIRVVTYEGDFNYSSINNFGETFASGKYLILLNNDTEVITRNWIEELLMYAQREDVGAVGCTLYYEDYSIQHAGIVLGLGAHRTAGHTHYRLHRENLGYMGRLCYAQDVTAVTGACLMTSRSLYESVGGLSEEFAVALNDVDLCLKYREKGLLNVFTPFAQLFHYESRSRGTDVENASKENEERYNRESERFREKWKDALAKGDPYFNPNFSLDHSNYVLAGINKGMV